MAARVCALGRVIADRHHCAGPVCVKSRFHVIVGRGIRQMHSLDVHNPAVGLEIWSTL